VSLRLGTLFSGQLPSLFVASDFVSGVAQHAVQLNGRLFLDFSPDYFRSLQISILIKEMGPLKCNDLVPQFKQGIAGDNVVPLLQSNENVQCAVDGTNADQQRCEFNLKFLFLFISQTFQCSTIGYLNFPVGW
jgi:hypothetical protein